MRQLARRFVLWMGASIVVAGCLSPTLPLPPPVAPEVEQVGQGEYLLHGQIPNPGLAFVLNKRTGDIDGAQTDREYAITVKAQPKDAMQVWYQMGDEVSDVVPFEIPEATAPSTGGTPSSDGGAGGASGSSGAGGTGN